MNYQNQDNVFVGIIDNDGVICQYANSRKGSAVGIDLQREKELQAQISEMQEVIENYYSKLVEVGVIVPEKSPAEIAQAAAEQQLELARQQAAQQAEMNASLLDAVKSLKSEIAGLKTARSASDNKPVTTYPIKNRKQSARTEVGDND